jgi:hypothetical protein
MKSDRCYFAVKGKRCSAPREPFSNFCSDHQATFAQLDNPTLLNQAADRMRRTMYVNAEKKLSCVLDMEVWGEFNNYLNELSGRGYNAREAMDAVGTIALERGLFDDLFQGIGLDPKWKRFEKIVAGIHMLTAEGAEVKFDDEIVGRRTGRPRQIDVSIRFKQTYYDYLAIIECKDYDSKVPIEKVEAFRTKIEDVGAMKGIMVSPKGFQEGAIKTAEAHNIELFTLTEIKSDWTKTIKADIWELPFPAHIEFDYPFFDATDLSEHEIRMGDLLFYTDQLTPPIPLNQLLREITKWVVSKGIALPCKVEAPYDPPLLTQFPGTTFFTPIYAIIVTFENSKFAFGREIDVPPKLEKYVYSDIAKHRVHEIPAKDVPPID